MSWNVKTKNDAAGTTATKIEQQGDDEKIVTPDGEDILVGENEDEVLLYQEEFNNWGIKTKIPA